jgi:transcription-repair coupling factor (superfamily II helicase)
MSAADILKLYQSSTTVLQISEKLNSASPAFVSIKNLSGSSGAFVAAALFAHKTTPTLFVLNDKDEAAYFYNDLQSIVGEKSILFFPSSYKHPYQVEEIDNANILQRAEVLKSLLPNSENNKCLIVTYPEALTERVVTKSHLEKNSLEIKQTEKLSIDFVTDMLAQYGFSREDFVAAPGQYAVRGGIVDVFSFADELPYRIEFFGDEVETIRTFDAATQLSIDKKTVVAILPNVEDKLLNESRQSFLEYMGTSAVLWINNMELCAHKLQKEYEAAELAFGAKQEKQSPIKHLQPNELFINATEFNELLKQHSVIHFSHQPDSFSFNTQPQQSFNKNFELLGQALKQNSENDIVNYIFSDTQKQTERLKAIFNDIGKEIDFSSVPLSLSNGFIDTDLKIACYTDHQIFERHHRFKLKNAFYKKKEALTLRDLKELSPGDFVTHIDHGIGRFGGLEKIDVNGKLQESIRIVYRDNDILYVSINSLHRIAKYSGKEGAPPKIDKIGSNAWQTLKQKTKKKVKEIAYDLIRLYAKRKSTQGHAYPPDNYLQNELEASFIYEDTPDQLKATNDVKRDMEDDAPMDRLVCGDVGFGKTEIAMRAAFKAVCDSKQVAVLVPTTILALQHYKTFTDRLNGFPCNIDYINRFKTAKEQKDTLQKLKEGKIDILIGTHKLAGNDVKFKDLGLLIIDEEQKFGVGVKDKLKTIKANVDTLTLTATPIPRTLQFSMMGARDLSIISTPPANRYPVHTQVHNYNEEIIRDAIREEVARGGQVFFIHNRVGSLPEIAGMIKRLCPDVNVAIGHGQMDGEQLEDVMLNFIEGDSDVLVSTTIVESGLDIPNANTIIINDAQNFGLSDIHQMRGRVGRTNKKAHCYLLVPSFLTLTDEARKRLKAIEEFSDLGSGFHIAMRDLDIRGAGNMLGAEQSGFITDIGYEMYQKILDEAIAELREEMGATDEHLQTDLSAADLSKADKKMVNSHLVTPVNTALQYVKDCVIETDLEILLPDNYVNNTAERLSLYRDLDESRTEENLQQFLNNLIDRFGPVPPTAFELIDTIRLRWIAISLGVEKIILKNNKMVCYFVANQKSGYYQSTLFSSVLVFVQQNSKLVTMRENKNKLSISFDKVTNIAKAKELLAKINIPPVA